MPVVMSFTPILKLAFLPQKLGFLELPMMMIRKVSKKRVEFTIRSYAIIG